MYWMITNRKLDGKQEPTAFPGDLSYFTSEGKGDIDNIRSWTRLSADEFTTELKREAARFPLILDPEEHLQQKHIGLFVHGFNNSWGDAARRYKGIADDLYSDMGHCVLFTWPSDGLVAGYYPDRIDARRSADELAQVLCDLYDWMLKKQSDAMGDPRKSCRAKISLIAHSMGAFVVQKGLAAMWTRKNQPLLASLLNQLVLVAADVDSDLFKSGEASDGSDGDAVANVCYRITALYTGRDLTLGLSAGLKHFGQRRLGRSGLSRTCATPPCFPSNVWDVDCTNLIDPSLTRVHSAYFEEERTKRLMREILIGTDRKVIENKIASGEI